MDLPWTLIIVHRTRETKEKAIHLEGCMPIKQIYQVRLQQSLQRWFILEQAKPCAELVNEEQHAVPAWFLVNAQLSLLSFFLLYTNPLNDFAF